MKNFKFFCLIEAFSHHFLRKPGKTSVRMADETTELADGTAEFQT